MIIGDSIPCVLMVVSDVFPCGLMVIPVIDSIIPIAARAESSPYIQALDPITAVVSQTNGVATTKADGEAHDAHGSHRTIHASLATAFS
jgi:hypothetical protein